MKIIYYINLAKDFTYNISEEEYNQLIEDFNNNKTFTTIKKNDNTIHIPLNKIIHFGTKKGYEVKKV